MNAVLNAELRNANFNDYTDEELFIEYRNFGSRRCFDELFNRYRDRLTLYLQRRVGSRDVAEDIFQSAFLRAMTKSEMFDSQKRFQPWLYRIALNQAIDLKRRSKRYDEAISLDSNSVERETESSSWADAIPSREPDPRRTTEESEAAQIIRQAVAQLPENLRQILELIFFQGLNRGEVAESLQLTSASLKTRLRAALRQLYRCSTSFGEVIPAPSRY